MSDLHDWIDSRLNQADELEERDWPTDEIIAKVKQECRDAIQNCLVEAPTGQQEDFMDWALKAIDEL